MYFLKKKSIKSILKGILKGKLFIDQPRFYRFLTAIFVVKIPSKQLEGIMLYIYIYKVYTTYIIYIPKGILYI